MDIDEILSIIDRHRADHRKVAQLCRELHDEHDWTWEEIGKRVGVAGTTALRWTQRLPESEG